MPGLGDLALTTNALLLPKLAMPLKAAGLKRINVHLDSLNPVTVERQMRWGSFARDMGRDHGRRSGRAWRRSSSTRWSRPATTRTDVVDLAALTIARDWHVRFIELMPLGGGECATLSIKRYVSNIETRRRIEVALGPLMEFESNNPSDEARNYTLPDASGVVGFISPVSEPYCGTCNRMRLTADGKFHLCLLNDDEMDVRKAIRSGGADGSGGAHPGARGGLKPTGHHLLEGRSTRDRSMYQIGG